MGGIVVDIQNKIKMQVNLDGDVVAYSENDVPTRPPFSSIKETGGSPAVPQTEEPAPQE